LVDHGAEASASLSSRREKCRERHGGNIVINYVVRSSIARFILILSISNYFYLFNSDFIYLINFILNFK